MHYSDWILEFQPRYVKDIISTQPGGKGDMLGHWCKVIFRKTPNEKTGIAVRYPIRYGRTNGKSIWVEYEVVDMLLTWDMAVAKGAWVTISDDLIEKYQSLDSRFIKNKASTFFLKARGQSMEPTIFPGEYLVVDRSIRPFWGRVCILAFEGQLVCKRVVKSQAGIILRSDNLKFKDIKVYNSKEVNFWGVVTARVGEVL